MQPARARRAVQYIGGAPVGDEQSARALLLSDIRVIFVEREAERFTSAELVEALVAIEGRPWAEWKAGKPDHRQRAGPVTDTVQDRPRNNPRRRSNSQRLPTRLYFDTLFSRYPSGVYKSRNTATT